MSDRGLPTVLVVEDESDSRQMIVDSLEAAGFRAAQAPNAADALARLDGFAYDALVVQGGLTSGRVALVHAGASGVGTAAIQLCRAIGARVVVTASTGKVDACRDLGTLTLPGYRMYASGQPCPMCMTAMLQVGLAEVWYAAPAAPGRTLVSPEELAERAGEGAPEVVSGVLADEALAMMNRHAESR